MILYVFLLSCIKYIMLYVIIAYSFVRTPPPGIYSHAAARPARGVRIRKFEGSTRASS